MSAAPNSPEHVRAQYTDPANLEARAALHQQFGTNPRGWYAWVQDQLALPDRCRVLELGCGTCGLWRANRERVPVGWQILLSDLSPGMLGAARGDLGGKGHTFTFQVADAQAIPFADESLDAVIANHMLYHVPDLERCLVEIRRALKVGGQLYAATNGAGHLQELRELTGRVTRRLQFSDPDRSRLFGLENGSALLERHFSNVVLRRYENALHITEVEPLIAYLLSTIGADAVLSDEGVEALRRIARERIATDGAIRVSGNTGMFAAQRPAKP